MTDPDLLEDFIGKQVVDIEGQPMGTLACYWEREARKALLLGVDIPERSGHTHLVPAQGARLGESPPQVHVPFTRNQITDAPCLPCVADVDDELEARVWADHKLPQPTPEPVDPLAQTYAVIRQKLRRIFREGEHRTPRDSSRNDGPKPGANDDPDDTK